MAVKCKTICINCINHYEKPDSRNIDVWYNHFCRSPEVARTEEQDPVSGKIGFADKNDLGGIYITDEQFPYCRDINHGNCQHYQSLDDPPQIGML